MRQLWQGTEVIGRQDFSLDDGEIDFDLIQPAGVNGSMNEYQVGIPSLKPSDGSWSAMHRAVVDNPEHSAGLLIRPLFHDLVDETVKSHLSVFGFAATEEFRPVDVQGGEIGPSPQPFVFVLDFHRPAGSCGQRPSFSAACLDAGLFIGGENELLGAEFTALPDALVQIQDPSGLGFKIGISRKDPAAVLPRPDGILAQPSPDGGITQGCGETASADMGTEFGHAPARKGHTEAMGEFAGDGFNLHD